MSHQSAATSRGGQVDDDEETAVARFCDYRTLPDEQQSFRFKKRCIIGSCVRKHAPVGFLSSWFKSILAGGDWCDVFKERVWRRKMARTCIYAFICPYLSVGLREEGSATLQQRGEYRPHSRLQSTYFQSQNYTAKRPKLHSDIAVDLAGFTSECPKLLYHRCTYEHVRFGAENLGTLVPNDRL
jgi:hypothetical protein